MAAWLQRRHLPMLLPLPPLPLPLPPSFRSHVWVAAFPTSILAVPAANQTDCCSLSGSSLTCFILIFDRSSSYYCSSSSSSSSSSNSSNSSSSSSSSSSGSLSPPKT